ncbi:MAG: restriction endonuclease [Candidatus Sumerlaeota bacterium]|nr:restriction endonuclease [Candidatus Sumerlaeota bacterium]
MNSHSKIESILCGIIRKYANSFAQKVYQEENCDHDLIMDIFGISPDLKRENRQYWGRELGMCWQLIVSELCKLCCHDYSPALRLDRDEPCDFCIKNRAIDTKYRIGSGDAGTLKKFKSYGVLLRSKGYTPITLLVRDDNLPAAMTALSVGQWEVYTGNDTFNYIKDLTGFDLKEWLEKLKNEKCFIITK